MTHISQPWRCVGHSGPPYGCWLKSICFTICLFISPDLDGNRAPRKALTLQDTQSVQTRFLPVLDYWLVAPDMFRGGEIIMYRYGNRQLRGFDDMSRHISPDLDGHRAPPILEDEMWRTKV